MPPETPNAETPYEREPGYASRYRDRRFREGTGAATHRRECRAIARLLQCATVPPGVWLDVPSGTGRLTHLLPAPAVRVDRDLSMLQAADDRLPRVQASASRLPFRDRAFAGVLCMRLLQHVPPRDERRAILRELARVSAGPVLVSFFDAASLQHLRRRLRVALGGRRSARVAVRLRVLREDLAAAGLRIVRVASLRRWFSEQRLLLAVRDELLDPAQR